MNFFTPFIGTFLGALPGMHPNLLALLPFSKMELFVVVFASLFSSIIPTLLMTPSMNTLAILLPGQLLVNKGKMNIAISEFLGGALLGTAIFIVLLPLYEFFTIIPRLFTKIFWLPLIGFAMIPIFRKKNVWKMSLLFFTISGIYGMFILNLNYGSEKILMAHFGGMFGLSGLMLSEKMKKQEIKPIKINFNFTSSFLGSLGGLLISLFPALTPAQASAFLFAILGNPMNQLASVGALTTTSFLFCFLSLRYLGKARSVAVLRIENLYLEFIIPIAILSFLVISFIAPYISKILSRWDLRKLLASSLIITIALFSQEASWIALPSLLLGINCQKAKIEKVNLMGSLMLPTIIWYLMH